MPDACRSVRLLAVAGFLAAGMPVWAAEPAKPTDSPKAAALKLPDGTIVLLSSTPDQADPPVNGVLLTGKEYEALLAQADQARQLKNAARSLAPSTCRIQAKVTTAGQQPIASLTLTYMFQSAGPRAVVALGCAAGSPGRPATRTDRCRFYGRTRPA